MCCPLLRPEVSVAAGEVYCWRPIAGDFSGHRKKWTPEVILGQVCSFLIFWRCWLGFYLLAVTFSMRGGCKRLVAIESKSFDFTIVGTAEDVLKISENGRGRRTSVFLPEHVALWADFISPNPPIGVIKCAKALRNRAEKFLQLFVVNKGKRTFVIFPPGWNERGWAMIFDALTEILSRPHQEH
ncbi:hypothetical protein Cgig2_022995 [Carnegiea gigantea]|uniref:Uncharacterized protein n=1 Tax=Carnegiea gigantea TaxID=171969 RepID=A0A9Q1JQ00_9CARY|nr:hypothetical protein Cgig2_022995 [Carnegiea gigantea]